MRRRGAGLLLVVLLSAGLAGCGLPLPSGVQSARVVPEGSARAGEVSVFPPGPAPGAGPGDIVNGFLRAQSSPVRDYAVAREFLAPGTEWNPGDGVTVYDPSDFQADQLQGSDVVAVRARRLAVVTQDGAYHRSSGDQRDSYTVRCTPQCRITAAPRGLRLSPGDLVRSFEPALVHFLAPSSGQATASGSLVADMVWLMSGADRADRLVRALLAGPSSALRGSVGTAVPPGTTLVAPVLTAPDGTVTVDVSRQVAALDALRRRQLSAQLVWTLRGLGSRFTALRLLVDGRPLAVEGATTQSATAWQAFDPERLRPNAPAFYLQDGQLRTLDGGLASSPATEGGLPAVTSAAASPDGSLGLLVGHDGAQRLYVGPQGGPFKVRATGALSSPTWGGGEQGLWLLRGGALLRVPLVGSPQQVAVEGAARLGPVQSVRLSRDGVRVALLVGNAAQPRLLVGRLVDAPDRPRVTDLREIVPGLSEVQDVAWESGTSLMVLASFDNVGRLPARVSVDGSSVVPLASRLPQDITELMSVAAAQGRPVVLGARTQQRLLIYRDNGVLFASVTAGRRPFYPG